MVLLSIYGIYVSKIGLNVTSPLLRRHGQHTTYIYTYINSITIFLARHNKRVFYVTGVDRTPLDRSSVDFRTNIVEHASKGAGGLPVCGQQSVRDIELQRRLTREELGRDRR